MNLDIFLDHKNRNWKSTRVKIWH